MAPKKLKGTKSRSRKGKRKKGKKKKKVKILDDPPPLHELTTLYNLMRERVFDLKKTQVTARKKRLEGWYLTREMLELKYDNQVYHSYLNEKMEDTERLIRELTAQLEKERTEVEKLIQERLNNYNKKLKEYKDRINKGELELSELKLKLLDFDHLIKKLAALMARLKELQSQIPAAELDANVKTRFLKNQYLNERAKLHNHLESELYLLTATCRSHLMPILSEHMYIMEFENRCSRWDLARLDIANLHYSQKKELLLEKRNNLNMEKGYLSLEWAFNKLAEADTKRKAELEPKRNPLRYQRPPKECELSIDFKKYLDQKLDIEREKQAKELRRVKWQQEQQRKLEIEMERARIAAEKAKKKAKKMQDEEDWEYLEGEEWMDEEEIEYYEDANGQVVMAPAARMAQHKALMDNKSLEEEVSDEGEGSSGSSSGSGSSYSGSSSSGSLSSDERARVVDQDDDDDFDDDDYSRKKAQKKKPKKNDLSNKTKSGASTEGRGSVNSRSRKSMATTGRRSDQMSVPGSRASRTSSTSKRNSKKSKAKGTKSASSDSDSTVSSVEAVSVKNVKSKGKGGPAANTKTVANAKTTKGKKK